MLQSNNKGGGGGPTEIRGENFFFCNNGGNRVLNRRQSLATDLSKLKKKAKKKFSRSARKGPVQS